MKKIDNQSGFVSIVVSMIIMIILTLITIGFANIMGREQRQAIDRQISAQAFYAAESGINDAATQLKLNPRLRKTDDCNPITITNGIVSGPVNKELDITNPNIIRSTCVTVDPDPDTLLFSPVSVDINRPTVTLLRGVNENNSGAQVAIPNFTINWSAVGNSTGGNRTSSLTDLVPNNLWDAQMGMLKVTLITFSPGNTRETITNNTKTFYLRPGGAGALPLVDVSTINGNSNAGIFNSYCVTVADNSTKCTTQIGNINDPSLSGGAMYLVLSSMYRPNNVYIEAVGGSVDFSDAQAVIDATGRNGDVLRRIQVRRSLRPTYDIPGGGLVSDGAICKLITAAPSPATTTDTTCGL